MQKTPTRTLAQDCILPRERVETPGKENNKYHGNLTLN
jgi:hypothetical protein